MFCSEACVVDFVERLSAVPCWKFYILCVSVICVKLQKNSAYTAIIL